MTALREAAQQALEALLRVKNHAWDEDTHEGRALITALKDALAEPVQEPRPIQECYGDCPTEPSTCANPCNFEGRVKPMQEPTLDEAMALPRARAEAYERGWNAAKATGDNLSPTEPVAWISESDNLLSWDKFYDHMKPLYTSPPQRNPLTEEEMYIVEEEARKNFRMSQTGPRGQMITYWDSLTPWLIRAVERAHGITP